jgi:hypothetical protein
MAVPDLPSTDNVAGNPDHPGDHNTLVAALQLAAYLTVVTKTSAYAASNWDFVLANATSGAFSVTSPGTAADAQVTIKKIDSSANAVTFVPASGTVDGASSFALVNQWDCNEFVSDGTNWFVS